MSGRRDMRDPTKLGERYLELRAEGMAIHHAAFVMCDEYEDGGFISSNPAEHHSQPPQSLGNLNDGGEA